jgi:hypothetical protein
LLETAAVNESCEGVARCFPGAAEFGCLHEDGELAQFRVPAAVVEVQMGMAASRRSAIFAPMAAKAPASSTLRGR